MVQLLVKTQHFLILLIYEKKKAFNNQFFDRSPAVMEMQIPASKLKEKPKKRKKERQLFQHGLVGWLVV